MKNKKEPRGIKNQITHQHRHSLAESRVLKKRNEQGERGETKKEGREDTCKSLSFWTLDFWSWGLTRRESLVISPACMISGKLLLLLSMRKRNKGKKRMIDQNLNRLFSHFSIFCQINKTPNGMIQRFWMGNTQ